MGLRVGGLSSGLDTNALIDSVLALERRPLDLVQQRKAQLEAERALFRGFDTRLQALRDAASALDNRSTGLTGPSVEEELLAFRVSSSDERVLTASVDVNGRIGSTDVRVDALASAAREVSSAFSSDSTPIDNRTRRITITPSEGDRISIVFDGRNTSLQDLRDLINDDPNNSGFVRAEVIFDGSGHRLILAGTETGAANGFTVGGNIKGEGGRGRFVDDSLSLSASDARLEVRGIPITRESNVVMDVIPGVALTLRGVSTSPVQVTVSRDDEDIAARVQTFVDAYNDVVGFVTEQSRYDAQTETAGPFSGDAVVRSIGEQIQRALVSDYAFTNTSFTSLAELGVGLGEGGKLALDAEKLTLALDRDAAGVRDLLGGYGDPDNPEFDGILAAITRSLDRFFVSDPKQGGILAGREAGYERAIRELDSQIDRLEQRLEKREELLVLQFTRLETTLAQLQNQGNSLLSLVTPQRSFR